MMRFSFLDIYGSFLLIILGSLLHNNFPTESRKVSPNGIVIDNFKTDAFRRITTHLIETIIVSRLGLCSFKCVQNVECLSFNFGNPVKGTHVCELLRTDKYNARPSYSTSTNFHYFFPGNKCMDPSPCQNNGSCYPDYEDEDYNCVCLDGTRGRNCEILSDCSGLRLAGFTSDGVYSINPDGQGSFPVLCDMTTDGGGWTVFHKRFDGSVNFDNGWHDYKTGFGNLSGEFWLGNDKIHRLTASGPTRLRVELDMKNGTKGYAVYSSFAIANESDSYRLAVEGYSGTIGDSLGNAQYPKWIPNGMKFSTPDNDTSLDGTCAAVSGWWYRECSASKLNSPYRKIKWRSFGLESLKKAQMKLK